MNQGPRRIGHFYQDGFIFHSQVHRGDKPGGRQFKYAVVEVQDSGVGDFHDPKIGSKKPSKNGVIHTNTGRASLFACGN
jgi:hypothetical protein